MKTIIKLFWILVLFLKPNFIDSQSVSFVETFDKQIESLYYSIFDTITYGNNYDSMHINTNIHFRSALSNKQIDFNYISDDVRIIEIAFEDEFKNIENFKNFKNLQFLSLFEVEIGSNFLTDSIFLPELIFVEFVIEDSLNKVIRFIEQQKNIQVLILYAKDGFSQIPNWIGEFKSLEYLDITIHGIEYIPRPIILCNKLKFLSLYSNDSTFLNLDNEILSLDSLERLYGNIEYSYANILILKQIKKLKAVSLYFQNSTINQLDSNILSLKNLEELSGQIRITSSNVDLLSRMSKLKRVVFSDFDYWNTPDSLISRLGFLDIITFVGIDKRQLSIRQWNNLHKLLPNSEIFYNPK